MYSAPRLPHGFLALDGQGLPYVPDSVVAQFFSVRGGDPAAVLIRSDLGLVEV